MIKDSIGRSNPSLTLGRRSHSRSKIRGGVRRVLWNRLGRNKDLNFRFYDVAWRRARFRPQLRYRTRAGAARRVLGRRLHSRCELCRGAPRLASSSSRTQTIGIGPGLFPGAATRGRFLPLARQRHALRHLFHGSGRDRAGALFCVANVSAKKQFLIDAGLFDIDFPIRPGTTSKWVCACARAA